MTTIKQTQSVKTLNYNTDLKQTGCPNLVVDTLLLGPTSLVDAMKDNTTGSSTLEVQSQLWKLKQGAICVGNRSKMGY